MSNRVVLYVSDEMLTHISDFFHENRLPTRNAAIISALQAGISSKRHVYSINAINRLNTLIEFGKETLEDYHAGVDAAIIAAVDRLLPPMESMESMENPSETKDSEVLNSQS